MKHLCWVPVNPMCRKIATAHGPVVAPKLHVEDARRCVGPDPEQVFNYCLGLRDLVKFASAESRVDAREVGYCADWVGETRGQIHGSAQQGHSERLRLRPAYSPVPCRAKRRKCLERYSLAPCDVGHAMVIGTVRRYKQPLDLQQAYGARPPQSISTFKGLLPWD